jgi:hypothetical protein
MCTLTSIAAYSYAPRRPRLPAAGVPLLTSWRGRPMARCWRRLPADRLLGRLLAWAATDLLMWTDLSDVFEILRNGAWSLFLVVLLGHWREPGSRLPLACARRCSRPAVCYLACWPPRCSALDLELLDSVRAAGVARAWAWR